VVRIDTCWMCVVICFAMCFVVCVVCCDLCCSTFEIILVMDVREHTAGHSKGEIQVTLQNHEVKERERVCVCVCERERERVCVCVCVYFVCMSKRER
jgi:hypothetical protein